MAFLKRSSLIAAFPVAMAIMAIASTTTSAQNTPQDFVDLHNRARAADGVGPVAWDAKVGKYAQDYAAKRAGDCKLVHSGGPFGENIFWGSAGRAWSAADAVKSWVDEKKNYHLSSNSCDPGKVCGHYTQVVWRESTRIGCARVVCAANRGVFIVCSYDPPGNFNGERPFLGLDAAAK
ncbi:pathogenesis-related protein PRB1-2-like [Miscanthus floridulus]|uniref:pathogenesis-related protein PRB1-2-like n=1 Tax=Miscanthus floridulus TaxID=154761 RepID=UPI00345A6F68